MEIQHHYSDFRHHHYEQGCMRAYGSVKQNLWMVYWIVQYKKNTVILIRSCAYDNQTLFQDTSLIDYTTGVIKILSEQKASS